MGILSGNPKNEPLHYGEVSQLWAMSLASKGCASFYQTFRSHAGDKDLQEMLKDVIQMVKEEIKECDALLQENGVVPTPSLPEKPLESWEQIPVGARFSDFEIAAALTNDNAIGLTACSAAMGASLREDVGALFARFHAARTAIGLRILRLNKEKGWIVMPPLQIEKKEPVNV